RPRHVEGVLIQDLPGQAGQAATGDESPSQRYTRRFAHRRSGAVDEHGAVADLIMAMHLEEHRVGPGFRWVIVEARCDQFYIGSLGRWPAIGVENVVAGRVGGKLIPGLEDALIV